MTEIETLDAKLHEEHETLERARIRSQEADTAHQQLEAELNAARLAADDEGERAILADRKPSPEFAKKAATLAVEVEKARNQARIARNAIERQAQTVEELQSAIFENRKAKLEAEIRGPAERLAQILEEFVSASVQVNEILRAYTQFGGAEIVFPPGKGGPTTGLTPRALKVAVFNAALNLAVYRARYQSTI
jgi:hypothetical protein